VSPASGETFWYVHDGVSKPFFEALLKTFAREAGAGLHRTIILVLDNAGWHGEAGLNIPEGVRLVFLPPYPDFTNSTRFLRFSARFRGVSPCIFGSGKSKTGCSADQGPCARTSDARVLRHVFAPKDSP
jgi:hypothetical protein